MPRARRSPRALAWTAGLLPACACANANTYTVPRTLDPGALQFVAAAEVYGFSTKASSTAPGTATTGVTPTYPTVGIRYGLVDGLDVGARVDNFDSLAADLKLRLLRGRFDVALDPGAQLIDLMGTSATGTTVNGAVAHFELPLLLGVNLNQAVSLVFGPGFAYSISSASASEVGGGRTGAGLSTEPRALLSVGVDVRTSETLAWHPEVTCMQGFASTESLLCMAGVGLVAGAQPRYDDLP